jgi:hypothetical protein
MLYGGVISVFEGCCGAGESFDIVKCLSSPFEFSRYRGRNLEY